MSFDTASFVSGLVGAAIGGWATLQAAKIAHQHNLDLARIQSLEEEKALLTVLHDDIIPLWNLVSSDLGPALSKWQHADGFGTAIEYSQDYFAVYYANCSKMGAINSDAIRHNLTGFYSIMRVLMDEIKLNTQGLKDLHKIKMEGENFKTLNIKQKATNDFGNDELAVRSVLKGKKESIERLFKYLVEVRAKLASEIPPYTDSLKVQVAHLNKRANQGLFDRFCSCTCDADE